MDTKTRVKKESGGACETEFFIGVCKVMAALLAHLSEEDQADTLEVLNEMIQSHTKEEIVAAEETIREILKPKTGQIVVMSSLRSRDDKVEKWSAFAGQKVRDFRKEAGLTQQELAERASLPQSHVSRIENDEVSPNRMTIEKIAKALGKSVRDFDPSA